MTTKKNCLLAALAVAAVTVTAGCGSASTNASPVGASPVSAASTVETPNESPSATETPTPTETPAVVTYRDEVKTEVVAFAKRSQSDPNLDKGRTALLVAGVAGQRKLTYKVTLTNGVESDRKLVSNVVVRNPVAQVTGVGTYVAPPPAPPAPAPVPAAAPAPAPAPSGCDPNYAGACVPIASDVDCAGGSGNGPAYVAGPVRVIGVDIYHLDGNHDGIGCN
ncbi:G5 domain-containing protein [Paenarthrobacter sp. DKR-5]|uniref:G5 domain-containing protein n=1 Tax=Paenarthrobacter sp. DKR-5 TaxID=2835535 RepID=UPI001BDBB70B|nr:G5 domain-containing protein [Paenarthrobacter sp. DKR-5]MBT1002230.1 G5 domain-containing protein [Paenarthrobacter sp. DKR-5]